MEKRATPFLKEMAHTIITALIADMVIMDLAVYFSKEIAERINTVLGRRKTLTTRSHSPRDAAMILYRINKLPKIPKFGLN